MKTEILDLILSAGAVAKFVLIGLGIFSIICWAIVFDRFWLFRRVRKESSHFLDCFSRETDFVMIYNAAKKYNQSPIARIFCAVHEVFRDVSTNSLEFYRDSHRQEVLHRTMRQVASREILKMERYLPFLATTASAAPFIGLFGTVWGIMESFRGIGSQGSASLAVVAPGISEALIATAAGLGAAIPAVMAYNFFVNRVKQWAIEIDNFRLELMNRLAS